jgi:hypothetical protein
VAEAINLAVADAFRKAVARQEAKERLAERRRQKEEVEAALRGACQAEVDGLKADLAALISQDLDMPLLDAIEFVTHHPGHRVALYLSSRNPEHDAGPDQVPYDRFTAANELGLLKLRAEAEGFPPR